MNNWFLKKRAPLVFLFQSIILFATQLISLIIATNFNILSNFEISVWISIIGTLAVRSSLLYFYNLHNGLWRYTNIHDIIRITKSTTIGTIAYAIVTYFLLPNTYFFSIVVIDWVLILFSLTSMRFAARIIREYTIHKKYPKSVNREYTNLLIVGAGEAGIHLCKNIKENRAINYLPVAFVDDDTSKIGSYIFDVPVVGKIQDIPSIINKFQIKKAVFAIPSANPNEKTIALNILSSAKIETEILPSTPDVLSGNVNITHIREINPLDILGRAPTTLDTELLNGFIRNKCLLITGAGGSVGSDLARQTSKYSPKTLILLDQIENPLLFIESEIKSNFPDLNLITLIADVTDKTSIENILSNHHPHIILHAAAHKHVPFMESNPAKAVKNNIGGTLAMAKTAITNDVETFVFVSTDKAANPSSVMGVTKRIGEILINTFQENKKNTKFVSVRFGNVFGSNASVVPIFKNQIETGGPVTITHPEVTRYFMSIQEASGLILQAGSIANGGEIFVLDMGSPIKIVELAETMISMYGLQDQIQIKFIGLRPGEKLHEVLNTETELLIKTRFERILTIQNTEKNNCSLNSIDGLLRNVDLMSNEQIKNELQRLVVNYNPQN